MLMDKRFSYDESIKSKRMDLIEEEFIIQCKEVFLAQCETEENVTEQAEIPSTSGENPQPMELSVSPLNFSDEESEDEIYTPFCTTKSPAAISQISENMALLNAALKSELANFESNPRPDPNATNIFEWCRQNTTNYPLLSKVALFFCRFLSPLSLQNVYFQKPTLFYFIRTL